MTINISLDTPKIYVTCLSAYNNGYLHGSWIDANQDPDDIHTEINHMLSTSPVADSEACEEYAIHDFENFDGVEINEYDSIEYISALALAIEEYGTPFSLYIEHLGYDDIEQAISDFQDNYSGCFESIEDYAQDYYQQTGQLETIEQAGLNSYYIDWSKIAHDWQCSGDLLFLEESYNEIHVFFNH